MLAALWDSPRLRAWAGQALLLLLFVGTLVWLAGNTVENLAVRSIRVGFDFLTRPANFPISESVIPYSPTDSFAWAYVVGVGNTLMISVLAILFATLLGLFVGLARRSAHPMLSGAAGVFVTVVRNTPLIVQLLFWYALATTALPAPRNALHPLPSVYLSQRGLYLPGIEWSGNGWGFAAGTTAILIAAAQLARQLRRRSPQDRQGGMVRILPVAGAVIAALLLAWATGIGARASLPELRGFNFTGGMRLSPEFAALMVGLVLYTAAFIGEIIRGGIDAVGRGQWEAGRALGLSERQTLMRIVMPQALRVIIPPLTTQYLSTVKNSTLALAVGFPELGLVIGTVINQTGQALESIAILLAVYLTIGSTVSLLMNWCNARTALATR
ncbi:amino acid ABC transporter permease [Azospirillum thiophilum]|uniref:Amino acid ABC transporter permease n=1 Tax=Azospirillum thiophilum TaxID=528244 RepID=A0AAC8W125_9PROT|nr:ABC transporter permease subunit [Azospirillum thiophilum]ALG73006.1 amino acid ABC transporter permease [Azospirillum thiophilum]KJR64077.1 amino acid ABC transporter permease [Azospirillum thiophilum]